ncbi:MAG TPA: L-threonylcarbamoyladenylate synthase [Burkholderiales bacterium]|jgi:L-threonylcarbamoyladenylate synthase|nr:L-threonylcarbamoyladenylate synthase [Burkholderiales bacterium]
MEQTAPASAPTQAEIAPVAPPPPAPVNIVLADEAGIARAVELLRVGEVVAFPTETVYGLGADAANADAVARIYALKGRPTAHPVIVHLAEAGRLDEWAVGVSEGARKLARAFWPGPLTLVLERASHVPDAVTGGQDTVGLRVPSHPVAQALLASFGGGVAAPSANKFGRVSPTLAEHVFADFALAVPLILDGGATNVGIESTIVDLSGERPRLLRPGAVPAAAVEEVLGEALAAADAAAPRASGTLPSHYAPKAHVKLVKRVEMLETLSSHKGRRLGVLALEVKVPRLNPALQRVVPAIATQYAHDLYAAMRALDAQNVDVILVETPPASPAWAAIHDRLARAARGTVESGAT